MRWAGRQHTTTFCHITDSEERERVELRRQVVELAHRDDVRWIDKNLATVHYTHKTIVYRDWLAVYNEEFGQTGHVNGARRAANLRALRYFKKLGVYTV